MWTSSMSSSGYGCFLVLHATPDNLTRHLLHETCKTTSDMTWSDMQHQLEMQIMIHDIWMKSSAYLTTLSSNTQDALYRGVPSRIFQTLNPKPSSPCINKNCNRQCKRTGVNDTAKPSQTNPLPPLPTPFTPTPTRCARPLLRIFRFGPIAFALKPQHFMQRFNSHSLALKPQFWVCSGSV